jgi:ribosomal protein S18 acetylase RimI-like enzyme
MVGTSDDTVLDDPVNASLRGRHAHLARRRGRVVSFASTASTFSAVPRDPGPQDWADLATLLGPGVLADLFSSPVTPPAKWRSVFSVDGLQMVGGPGRFGADASSPDVVELGEADVPEMLDLVARTRPGPFWPGTHQLGRYVGVREQGRLVAMAGERLRPPGWTEISAVCTDPRARGRGLAARLVQDVAAHVVARGERPFLHVSAENPSAIALYERLGFAVRRTVTFRGYRIPAT